ncbi:hypothetical protein MA16_Dca009241 [Dendrobium catenatum]|uniref:Uncharacterized protein n=1 Tax=Dendrobium catenatum TaxID=906689 RepID=A0A2I0WYT7_9ASPA|nr:hypothetical protein MA16_Dca009241 [Dendrobium catenatum]
MDGSDRARRFDLSTRRTGVRSPAFADRTVEIPQTWFEIYLDPLDGFGRSWTRWTRERCSNVSLVDVDIQKSLDLPGFVLERIWARVSPESGRRRLEAVGFRTRKVGKGNGSPLAKSQGLRRSRARARRKRCFKPPNFSYLNS